MAKLILCDLGISEEKNILFNKIIGAFKNIHKEDIDTSICDLDSFEPQEESYLLIFNTFFSGEKEKYRNIWFTHQVDIFTKDNIKKKEVFELLKEISVFIKNKDKSLLVEKDSVKLGIGGDITLNKEEIEYLNKIKELVNGGDIIIKKNDLEIRIKNND
jgi:hypothetical protein